MNHDPNIDSRVTDTGYGQSLHAESNRNFVSYWHGNDFRVQETEKLSAMEYRAHVAVSLAVFFYSLMEDPPQRVLVIGSDYKSECRSPILKALRFWRLAMPFSWRDKK